MIKKVLFASTLIMFLFSGMGQAQVNDLPGPGILPDSPFYFLKSFFENVGTFFTFGERAKAERFLNLAEKRLAETKALAEKGNSNLAQRMVHRHQEQLGLALSRAERAKTKGLDVDEVLVKISEATLRHRAVLAEVYERVPDEAKPAIERAMENSMRGHEQALKGVSGEKQEEVNQQMERVREETRKRIEQIRQKSAVDEETMTEETVPEALEEIEDITPELPEEMEALETEASGFPKMPGR